MATFITRIAYARRVIATGICFTTFVMGGLILTLAALPIILLFPRTEEDKQRFSLALIHRGFHLFMAYLRWMQTIRSFRVEGVEQFPSGRGRIFIANHPTLIDVVAIISRLPDCLCLVKSSLLRRFSIGGLMRAAGYIGNDHPEEILRKSAHMLGSRAFTLNLPGRNTFSRGRTPSFQSRCRTNRVTDRGPDRTHYCHVRAAHISKA